MRIVLLILLILINTFSLPLQAMSQYAMSADLPCDMQNMSSDQTTMTDMANMTHCMGAAEPGNLISDTEKNHYNGCQTDSCNDCNAISLISFINHDKLIIDTHKQNSIINHPPILFLRTYQDNLYRPPLIN